MSKRRSSRRIANKEGNKFDKIIKENLEALLPALARKVLGIHLHRMENLPQHKIQTTRELEPDFIKLAYTDRFPEGCVLHLEFQGQDRRNTDSRMLQYVAVEFHHFQLPVQLHVIHLPQRPPRHTTGTVKFEGLEFSYAVHFLGAMDYRTFLHSSIPEEVLLALLANPEPMKAIDIIAFILRRLLELTGDKDEIWKFINQLKILSLMRNLQGEVEKQVEEMALSKNLIRKLKDDKVYKIGLEQGLEKGLEQGLEQGLEKGTSIQQLITVYRMHEKGFSLDMIAEVLNLEPDKVATFLEQVKNWHAIATELKSGIKSIDEIAKKFNVSPLLVEAVKIERKQD